MNVILNRHSAVLALVAAFHFAPQTYAAVNENRVCENSALKIEMHTSEKGAVVIHVQKRSNQLDPITSGIYEGWDGFSLTMERQQCTSIGTFCKAQEGSFALVAWDKKGRFIDIPKPIAIEFFMTYRLHARITFANMPEQQILGFGEFAATGACELKEANDRL